jgi:hypothetical protein
MKHVHLSLKKCSPKLGYWYTYCCCQDAEKITSTIEVEDVIETQKRIGIAYKIFRTKQDLIDALCTCEDKTKCTLLKYPLK